MLVLFALVLPILMTMVVGGIDVAMAELWAQNLQFGVESAAWCAGSNDTSCSDAASTLNYVATNTGLPSTNFAVNWTAPCGILVSTHYTYQAMVIPNVPYTFNACYPCRSC